MRAARRCAARGGPRARHGAGSGHAAADVHGAGGAAAGCCLLCFAHAPPRSLLTSGFHDAQGKAGPDGVRPPSWPEDEDEDDDSDAEYDDDSMGTPLLDATSLASSPPVTPRVVSAPFAWAQGGGASGSGASGSSGSSGGSRGGGALVEGQSTRCLDLRDYANRSNVNVRWQRRCILHARR